MHPLDFLFLLRPILLIPVWIIFLLGYHRAGASIFHISRYFILGFLTFTFLMGTVYIINQIADIETDRANKKLFILPEGLVSVKSAHIEIIVLVVAVFGLSFYFPPTYRIFLLISFLLGLLYSVKPFKFKSRPYLDLFSNAVGHGFLAFSLGWLSFREFSFDTFVYSIPYDFAIGGVFLLCTVIDIAGDRKTGEKTTGVCLGETNTTLFATILMICSVVSSIFVRDFICLSVASISTLFFVFVHILRQKTSKAIQGKSVSRERSRKLLLFTAGLPVYSFTLVCCFLYPWFLVVLILLVLLTRFYYKKRFDVVYPKI